MPRRKSKSRRRRRRQLPLTGFPKSKLVRLRYVDEVKLDAPSGLTTFHNFMANGIYDPDVTGTGHQPLAHDEWSAIYDRYTVVGAKISVTPVATDASGHVPGYYGVVTIDSDDAASLAVLGTSELLEQKYSTMTPKTFGSTISNPAQDGHTSTVTATFSSKKWFGSKSITGSGGAYSANFGASPAEQAYFGVYTAAINGNNPDGVTFNVVIDYIVLLQQPKLLFQS